MKAHELIAALQEWKSDEDVYIFDNEWGVSLELESVYKNAWGDLTLSHTEAPTEAEMEHERVTEALRQRKREEAAAKAAERQAKIEREWGHLLP